MSNQKIRLIDLCLTFEDFTQKLQEVQIEQYQRVQKILQTSLQEVKLFINCYVPPVTLYIQSQKVKVKDVVPSTDKWNIDGKFYIEKQQMNNLALKFLVFLYIGKIDFSDEDYLPLIKLAYITKCQELLKRLIKNPIELQMSRSFSIDCLNEICKNEIFQTEDGIKFIEKIIISNQDNIFKHPQWQSQGLQKSKLDSFTYSLKQIDTFVFDHFVNILIQKEQFEFLNQLLFYLEKYHNPNFSVFTYIYISKMFEIVNEDFINKYQKVLPGEVLVKLEKICDSKQNKSCFHVTRTTVCDLVNKSFTAKCGHKICLNCLFQYLIHKSSNTIQTNKPIKVRCFSRLLDINNCDCIFDDEDFKQLKNEKIPDIQKLINQFLKIKI